MRGLHPRLGSLLSLLEWAARPLVALVARWPCRCGPFGAAAGRRGHAAIVICTGNTSVQRTCKAELIVPQVVVSTPERQVFLRVSTRKEQDVNGRMGTTSTSRECRPTTLRSKKCICRVRGGSARSGSTML